MVDHLSALLQERRQDLIDRWTAAVKRQSTIEPIPTAALVDHMPRFIDELIAALHPEALPLPSLGETAVEHGAQRLDLGFNVGEVVREYGLLHRCIIEIAVTSNLPINPREQSILAGSLTSGIASAVSQYVKDRDTELLRQMSEHLGFIAHEVRNPLSSARIAFRLLRKRDLAAGGRVVELLDRTLQRTSDVIDNALNHAALSLGVTPRLETVVLRGLLDEVVFDCAVEAQAKDIQVVIEAPSDLALDADPRLLHSALANLLRNALKFTPPGMRIHLRARRTEARVEIDVEDACGGLPPGRTEELFEPLVQRGKDQSGYGLGLAITHQAVSAHNGTIRVRDLPGQGCVFTIDLPAPRR